MTDRTTGKTVEASVTHPNGRAGGGTAAPPPTPERRTNGLALAVIATAQLMVVLDVSIVNVALPSMKDSLGFSWANLEWVVNAYTLAFGGLLLLGGRACDLYGQRRVFLWGVSLLAVASLLGGLATTQAWLVAARAAQGVCGAMVAPAALALIATMFTEGKERNRAMGVYAAMSGAGGAIGNLLGGVFTDVLSWRWVLFVNVPIALVLALLGPRVLRESRTRKEPLDLPGALTATAGATLLVYGLVNAATHDWGDALTMGPIVGGLVLLALFVVVEARSSDPLMPLSIFSNRNRTGSYIIMFAIGAVLFAMFYFLTLFMQQVAGYSPLKTGLAFLPFAVIVMVLAGVAGQLVGKIGPKPLLMTGTLLAAGALFWFSRLSAEDGYTAQLLGPLLLIGAGVAICFVPLTLAAVAGVHDHEAGISSAVLNTGQQVGGSLGLAVLGTVAAHLTRDRVADLGAAANQHSVGAAYADGYARAFGIAGFVMIAAFLVAALVIRVRKDEIDPEMAGAAI